MMKTVNVITMGCSKNLVDSEHLLKQLEENYQLSFDENKLTDIVIINTCGFIGDAKEESIEMIMQYVQAKQDQQIEKLFVTGCLSERYKDELRNEIPEVDQFFGVSDLKETLKALQTDFNSAIEHDRFLTTPTHYAYLKISEGCDWKCSYCAIPIIRGKHKSVPIEHLIEETNRLANKGVKELILIAQDLTYYGIDLYNKRSLRTLIQKLSEIDGIEWIRLQYAYPAAFPMDVIQEMKQNPKVCNYLDIPFQHINTEVLKKMRRGINRDKTLELIREFRSEIPEIALRTTLIVGHPGEGEAEFNELIEFVERTKFERLGVFAYSEEEDTFAANYPDTISDDEKQMRVDSIMDLQQSINLELNTQKVGKSFKVIIDKLEGEFYVARTEFDSPEVDNEVLIAAGEDDLKIGAFYMVEITDASEYDLYAEIKKGN